MRPRSAPGWLLAAVALASCSGAPTSQEPTTSTVTVTTTATATQSVTATETITHTQTAEVTLTQDSTEEAAPTEAPETAAQDTPSPTPTPPAGAEDSGFDEEWAHVCAGRIVEDIELVDERIVHGGPGVSRALNFLAESYDCLAERGAPPGVDGADYLSRLLTLQEFAEQASSEAGTDLLAASARYSIIREETPAVLDMLNEATGSNFSLP